MKILRTRISTGSTFIQTIRELYRRTFGNSGDRQDCSGIPQTVGENSDLEGAALSLEAVLPENQAKDGWNFELRKSKDVLDSRRVIIGYIHHQDGAKG